MTTLGAYLRKLLYQYDCVIVPELGGFLTNYQPATFVAGTGQFLPPRKRVGFNEALRLDDGLLLNYVMLHEQLPREEAQRKISQFVTGLRLQVQQSGRFVLEGIGLFTLNDEGSLQFEPELRHNFYGEAFGMAAIPAVRLTEESLAETAAVVSLGPVLAGEVIEQTPFMVVHRPQRFYIRWVAAAVVVGTLGVLSYFSVIQPGQPLQSSFNPASIFQVPAALTETWNRLTEVKPVRTPAGQPEGPVLTEPQRLPVMTVPQAPAAEPVSAPVPATTPEPVVSVPAAAPAGNEAKGEVAAAKRESVKKPLRAVEKNETAVAVNPEETGTPDASEARPAFIVVAGSFASRPNAVRFRKSLLKAGYADAYIILPDQSTRLYKVAAVGFPQKADAVASVDSLSKLTGIPAWVMRN
ncbi:HU domain-containing protein [Arsenicibacter rosenii]|uniref:SPOR domain-containing protein n=1 Tax=Arsenicibacter rosenii TaxID=1750698 RepID=A0A1S2VQ67_9BACT|nr:SPOR domain-containing protein [Arsenicibacter rosenii]OIN60923.1 hypothetical protein BLX24_02225 [Arsenicibacter rosenii]